MVGGQKCGTTTLHRYLSAHPRIRPAPSKEVHYFDLNFSEGLDWYRDHFPFGVPGWLSWGRLEYLTGEATPYYIFHPLVPERVALELPEVKLIALLRDPVDRAYSHFIGEKRKNNEPLTFEEAIGAEAGRLRGEKERLRSEPSYMSHEHRWHSYLARGRYAEQLRRWRSCFPDEGMLIVQSEEMFRRPKATMAEIFSFLGRSMPGGFEPAHANRRDYSPMNPETRARLERYFEPHNQELYDLIGTEFDW